MRVKVNYKEPSLHPPIALFLQKPPTLTVNLRFNRSLGKTMGHNRCFYVGKWPQQKRCPADVLLAVPYPYSDAPSVLCCHQVSLQERVQLRGEV